MNFLGNPGFLGNSQEFFGNSLRIFGSRNLKIFIFKILKENPHLLPPPPWLPVLQKTAKRVTE